MFFNVSQLLRSEVGASRRYELDPEPPVLSGKVELIRTPGGILVYCDAVVAIEDKCSFCVAPFGYLTTISFEEIFVQQTDPVSGKRLEMEDPESFVISLENTIDISEAVRQYTEMAAEMQPLCRPDCPGICPVCGTDLNIVDCQCDRTPVDPRWEALVALKRRTNG